MTKELSLPVLWVRWLVTSTALYVWLHVRLRHRNPRYISGNSCCYFSVWFVAFVAHSIPYLLIGQYCIWFSLLIILIKHILKTWVDFLLGLIKLLLLVKKLHVHLLDRFVGVFEILVGCDCSCVVVVSGDLLLWSINDIWLEHLLRVANEMIETIAIKRTCAYVTAVKKRLTEDHWHFLRSVELAYLREVRLFTSVFCSCAVVVKDCASDGLVACSFLFAVVGLQIDRMGIALGKGLAALRCSERNTFDLWSSWVCGFWNLHLMLCWKTWNRFVKMSFLAQAWLLMSSILTFFSSFSFFESRTSFLLCFCFPHELGMPSLVGIAVILLLSVLSLIDVHCCDFSNAKTFHLGLLLFPRLGFLSLDSRFLTVFIEWLDDIIQFLLVYNGCFSLTIQLRWGIQVARSRLETAVVAFSIILAFDASVFSGLVGVAGTRLLLHLDEIGSWMLVDTIRAHGLRVVLEVDSFWWHHVMLMTFDLLWWVWWPLDFVFKLNFNRVAVAWLVAASCIWGRQCVVLTSFFAWCGCIHMLAIPLNSDCVIILIYRMLLL